MTTHWLAKPALALATLLLASTAALPMGASAHDWHDRGWHGRGHYDRGWHDRGWHDHDRYDRGHWSGGRWVAGAIVAGAVIGLVDNALRPAPVYYGPPRTVIYEDAPVVRRRVVETRTVVYDDPYQTRYIRDDGYDDDD